RMATFEPDGLTDRQWALAEPGRHYLVYSAAGATIRLDLSATRETFQAHWIDTRTGAVNERQGIIQGGQVVDVATPGSGSCVLWLARHGPGGLECTRSDSESLQGVKFLRQWRDPPLTAPVPPTKTPFSPRCAAAENPGVSTSDAAVG